MIGKKLKEYRLSLKLTGETLAGLAGIKRSWLSQIENEKKVPPFDTFMDLVNAIAKASPLNDENYKEVLSDENFEEFYSLLQIEVSRVFTGECYKNYEISFYAPDVDSNFDMNIPISEKQYNILMDEDSKKAWMKKFFIEDWKMPESHNPECIATYTGEVYIYDFPFIREALYEWWYNQILQNFYHSGKEIDETSPNFDSEVDILINIGALANENDEFLLNDDSSTNLTKELLDGKTVTFDLGTITDKNMRLFLDGKLLSSNEIAMLSFALGGIRHNRQKSDNK